MKWKLLIYPEKYNFLTDKLSVATYTSCITILVHFCSGIKIWEEKKHFKEWGEIKRNYQCDNCGYVLKDNERFMIKLLEFSENIFPFNDYLILPANKRQNKT
jgi:hypothetical protein